MKKIPFLLRALPLLALWLLGGSLLASTPVPGPVYPTAAPADICELPPPDTVWIVGATTNSIKIGWTPVPGAYSYLASVTNLDGGGAPPPQTILAPQTDATFFVSPGKYKFEVKATSCLGGSYGEGRTVIGSTAIIIDEIIAEFCTPNPNNFNNFPPNDITVCLPYGLDPEQSAPVRITHMEGSLKRTYPPANVNWKVEFSLMMPCPGGWAYQIDAANTQNVVVGGVSNPNGSFSELTFSVQGFDNATIFKINGLSWCTSDPAIVCPGQNGNNGCGHGKGSCILDYQIAPGSGIAVSTVYDNRGPTDASGYCYGKAPNYGWCINSNPKAKSGPGGDHDPHTFTPSDDNNAGGLLRVAPNPFTHGATITFDLPEDTPLLLTLYDAMGRPVKTLEQTDTALAGVYHSDLDADELPPGVYYLVLQTDQERRITTLVKSE